MGRTKERAENAENAESFKFCPSCTSPRISFVGGRKWICPECGFEYFHNVATSATIILDVEGSLVLLKRAKEPRRGFWSLPGGFVEPAERAEEAALRECREEVGWAPEKTEFLATFPNVYRYKGIPYATCDLYFYAEAAAADAAGFVIDPQEATEVGIFPPNAIPWGDIAFDSAKRALRMYILAIGTGMDAVREEEAWIKERR